MGEERYGDVYSTRFGRSVIVTHHARARMAEREVTDAQLLEIIETGDMRRVDAQHLFLYKRIAIHRDNLVCAAVVEESHLVVKTVMVNWTLREQP
jgi:hypothetical protein